MVWLMRAVWASARGYPTACGHTPSSENYAYPDARRTDPCSPRDVSGERETGTPNPLGWREHLRDPVDHRLARAVQAATMKHGAVMVWGLGRHGYRMTIITPTTSEGAKAERPPQVDRFGPQ